jgi:tRNA A37 threonylcarbamoyladenosine synthetase subunit TsaC/SUA5/YrdC
MKSIDQQYVETHSEEIISAIKAGKIFIYPTDTIYGIGTNANVDASVRQNPQYKTPRQ